MNPASTPTAQQAAMLQLMQSLGPAGYQQIMQQAAQQQQAQANAPNRSLQQPPQQQPQPQPSGQRPSPQQQQQQQGSAARPPLTPQQQAQQLAFLQHQYAQRTATVNQGGPQAATNQHATPPSMQAQAHQLNAYAAQLAAQQQQQQMLSGGQAPAPSSAPLPTSSPTTPSVAAPPVGSPPVAVAPAVGAGAGVSAGAVAPAAPTAISTELLQTYLDENQMLLEAIVQQQNNGKLQNTLQYQVKLQQNLIFLATLADAHPHK